MFKYFQIAFLTCSIALASHAQNLQTTVAPTQTKSYPVLTTNKLPCPDINCFIHYEVQKNHFSKPELEQFFAQTIFLPKILDIMNRPGTAQPWYKFRQNNVSRYHITGGQKFFQKHQITLNTVAQKYGIPAELLTAILGIETQYGRFMGSFRTMDTLTTLAFYYPRRSLFFQKELEQFLLMVREQNRDPSSYLGSYAGAMGMPQFMPSSYLTYAIDENHDGFPDIWHNVSDSIASIANYLVQYGWQSHQPMMIPLYLIPNLPEELFDTPIELNHTIADFRRMGLNIPKQFDDKQKALIFRLEVAPKQYQYWLGLQNFYVVWQYNHSFRYVNAVREIANQLGANL